MNNYLLWTVVALNVIDVISTYLAIKQYGGREANPIVKWLMDRLGLIGGILAIKVAALSPLFLIPFPDWLLGVLIGWYSFVAVNNVSYIIQKR